MPAMPPGYPQPQKPAVVPDRTPWWVYLEDILILLAIASLWPTVFRMRGPVVFLIQGIALVTLLVIFVLRLRRMLAARRKAEDDARRL